MEANNNSGERKIKQFKASLPRPSSFSPRSPAARRTAPLTEGLEQATSDHIVRQMIILYTMNNHNLFLMFFFCHHVSLCTFTLPSYFLPSVLPFPFPCVAVCTGLYIPVFFLFWLVPLQFHHVTFNSIAASLPFLHVCRIPVLNSLQPTVPLRLPDYILLDSKSPSLHSLWLP